MCTPAPKGTHDHVIGKVGDDAEILRYVSLEYNYDLVIGDKSWSSLSWFI